MSTRSSQVRARGRENGPHLRVVRRGSRGLLVRGGSRRLVSYGIAASIVVLAVVFAVLLEQVVLAQSAFKLKGIQDRLVAAESQHKELMLEAARLESSDRIERFARDRLGMVEPDMRSVSYIQADVVGPDRSQIAEESPAPDPDAPGTAVGAP
jgi:cell division protein FtsL